MRNYDICHQILLHARNKLDVQQFYCRSVFPVSVTYPTNVTLTENCSVYHIFADLNLVKELINASSSLKVKKDYYLTLGRALKQQAEFLDKNEEFKLDLLIQAAENFWRAENLLQRTHYYSVVHDFFCKNFLIKENYSLRDDVELSNLIRMGGFNRDAVFIIKDTRVQMHALRAILGNAETSCKIFQTALNNLSSKEDSHSGNKKAKEEKHQHLNRDNTKSHETPSELEQSFKGLNISHTDAQSNTSISLRYTASSIMSSTTSGDTTSSSSSVSATAKNRRNNSQRKAFEDNRRYDYPDYYSDDERSDHPDPATIDPSDQRQSPSQIFLSPSRHRSEGSFTPVIDNKTASNINLTNP